MLILISLLSFLLPTQLAFHFNNFQNSVYGFNIDYLIPTLYLTDIIALLIILLGISKIKFNYKYILYIIFVVINILISSYLVPSVYRWLRVTEMIALGIVIFNTKSFDVFRNFVKPLSYTVSVACILGLLQYFNKGSIGGIFYWLGERSFIFNDPNIASYPYSTFSHPNSFAGFLLVFAIFLLQYKNKFNIKYFWTLLILVATNLVLTNSLNVYMTTAFLLLLRFRKNAVFSLLSLDLGQRFVTHRLELIKAAFQMIKENFFFGVGLNNFIPNLVKVSNTYLNSWELQPVHNIFLLVFSETGIIGLLAFGYLLLAGLTTNSYGLIAVLFSGLSDHYWLTLQQNLLLFVFVLVITKKKLVFSKPQSTIKPKIKKVGVQKF
ncbi:MAG: O-antigen ligase family protein [Candidatus Woesebacteria bacterium]|nr:O-antigen ligase family protein [Candidatus Woesebacteria bacterium]